MGILLIEELKKKGIIDKMCCLYIFRCHGES